MNTFKIKKKPKFKFEHLPDSYDDVFTAKKSHYTKDLETMMKNIKGTAEINLFDVCLNFTAKKTGIIEVNGVYKPFINFGLVKEIKFGFNVEPNVLDNALKRFKTLFDSLAEIQGNYNFIF